MVNESAGRPGACAPGRPLCDFCAAWTRRALQVARLRCRRAFAFSGASGDLRVRIRSAVVVVAFAAFGGQRAARLRFGRRGQRIAAFGAVASRLELVARGGAGRLRAVVVGAFSRGVDARLGLLRLGVDGQFRRIVRQVLHEVGRGGLHFFRGRFHFRRGRSRVVGQGAQGRQLLDQVVA